MLIWKSQDIITVTVQFLFVANIVTVKSYSIDTVFVQAGWKYFNYKIIFNNLVKVLKLLSNLCI